MRTDSLRADLTTEYCGLKFLNPFVLASSPVTSYGSMIKKAFSLGWGGAVIKTLKPDNMDVIDVSPRFATLETGNGEIIGFQNIELITRRSLSVWLDEIREIKEEFPDRILIGSIIAEMRKSDWQEMVKKVQEAGIDALELNFSCPHGMPEKGMGSAIGQVPEVTKMVTSWVKEVARVPVIVKLTPNVTDVTAIAQAALEGGADGLAAINTVQCLIGVDLDTFTPLPSVNGFSTYGGYSGVAIKPIGLRIVSQLARSLHLPISGIGGISTWKDAVEYMLLGARNVQICTEVMLKGYGIITELVKGLESYLQQRGFTSVEEMIGLSLNRLTEHSQLNRSRTLAVALNREVCIDCGSCVEVCRDSGCTALKIDSSQTLTIDKSKCDGCSLCTFICHHGALTLSVVQ